MIYIVQYKDQAREDLKYLERHEPNAYRKALALIAELYEHPYTGTAQTQTRCRKPWETASSNAFVTR